MAGTPEDVIEAYERHVSKAHARIARLGALPVEVRSEGATVWDDQGRRYLDCGGYGVFLLGHRHPDVLRAVHDQLDRHPLATRSLLSRELAEASTELTRIAPPGLDYVYFGNSGAEAVEIAIKLGRAAGRRRLISMRHGFHGKTLGALSVTDRRVYQQPFRPLLPDVDIVPFADIDALRSALARESNPACVIVEPVQAEGGVQVPPRGYLSAVADACREAGAFLVADEIQTGTGRLGGTWWGCDQEGVVPDILLAGKSLGGGCVPVSAVIGTERAFLPLNRDPRLHTSTFSGSPLASAAVCATIKAIEKEDLLSRAQSLGRKLLDGFTRVTAGDSVRQVRGRGLLLGIELATPAMAACLIAALLKRGVIVAGPLNTDLVVRFTPPAVMTDQEANIVINAVGAAVAELKELLPQR